MIVAFGIVATYATPIVLDPLFNRFTPLPAGATRTAVLDLAREAGVDVGEVYEMDASRRTTAANAYVTGIGHTKRVVLYDTLLRDFSPDEVRLVVAHELGHVHHRDVPHGLLYLDARGAVRDARRRARGRAGRPAEVAGDGGGGAGRHARGGPHGARHHRRLEPALARGGGARRPVLARADRRAARR